MAKQQGVMGVVQTRMVRMTDQLNRILARLDVKAESEAITVERLKRIKKSDRAAQNSLTADMKAVLSGNDQKKVSDMILSFHGELDKASRIKGLNWQDVTKSAKKPLIDFLSKKFNLSMKELDKGKIGRYGNELKNMLFDCASRM